MFLLGYKVDIADNIGVVFKSNLHTAFIPASNIIYGASVELRVRI